MGDAKRRGTFDDRKAQAQASIAHCLEREEDHKEFTAMTEDARRKAVRELKNEHPLTTFTEVR
jgi:hypothetical protein